MKQHFYSHLIEIESVYTRLTLLGLTEKERKELESLIESSVHHTVLDTILSKLSEDNKRRFLAHMSSADHERIWDFLKRNIKNVEVAIRKEVDALKHTMHRDIENAKKK